jgi:hypothetical protein
LFRASVLLESLHKSYIMCSLDHNSLEYVRLNSGVYLAYDINYLTKQNIDSWIDELYDVFNS